MPPLREHKEDIPAIIEALLADMNTKHGREVKGVDSEMLTRLMAHDWPGNVRELRNTIERAVLFAEKDTSNPPPAAYLRPTFRACGCGCHKL